MKSFHHLGKSIEFWKVTGEVISNDKYSETHVSSSGGGGVVGQHGGHVSAPRIHSTSITNHQFWIRTEDGEEQPIHLRGVDIPLRVGQKITLISASRKGAKDGWISILVNHSAGRHWFVKNAIGLNRQLSIDVFTGKSIIIAGVLGFALFYVTTNYTSDASVFVQMAMDWLSHAGLHYVWHLRVETVMNAMPFVIPGIYLIYRGFTKVVRSIILHKRLQSHLNKLAQSVYTDTEST